jgi:hypothetical protein
MISHAKAGHRVPREARYEDVQQKLKRPTSHSNPFQLKGMPLQDSAAAIGQLAHWAIRLPQHFIQSEAARGFVGSIRNQHMKLHLLMGGERTPDQALRLEEATVAATMPARLQVIRVGAPKGPSAAGLSVCNPYDGSVGISVFSGETANRNIPPGHMGGQLGLKKQVGAGSEKVLPLASHTWCDDKEE